MNKDKLIEQIKRHEGLRLKPYYCTERHLTIGYGRNLDSKGISEREAELMLDSDVEEFYIKLIIECPSIATLDSARQNALLNMAFNLGINGLMKFKFMFKALANKDYLEASKEMLRSRWAKQVGNRAVELSEQMRTGEYG